MNTSVYKDNYYDSQQIPLKAVPRDNRIHPIDAYTNRGGYSSKNTPPPKYKSKSHRL